MIPPFIIYYPPKVPGRLEHKNDTRWCNVLYAQQHIQSNKPPPITNPLPPSFLTFAFIQDKKIFYILNRAPRGKKNWEL